KREGGVEDDDPALPGNLVRAQPPPSARTMHVIQRKRTGLGDGLGRTAGWVQRAAVRMKNVQHIAGAQYDSIDDQGLHNPEDGQSRLLEVDHVVLCTGQESVRELYSDEKQGSTQLHIIGGADVAAELDAKRAIRQGAELAAKL